MEMTKRFENVTEPEVQALRAAIVKHWRQSTNLAPSKSDGFAIDAAFQNLFLSLNHRLKRAKIEAATLYAARRDQAS
jgi:hypothetical protein